MNERIELGFDQSDEFPVAAAFPIFIGLDDQPHCPVRDKTLIGMIAGIQHGDRPFCNVFKLICKGKVFQKEPFQQSAAGKHERGLRGKEAVAKPRRPFPAGTVGKAVHSVGSERFPSGIKDGVQIRVIARERIIPAEGAFVFPEREIQHIRCAAFHEDFRILEGVGFDGFQFIQSRFQQIPENGVDR